MKRSLLVIISAFVLAAPAAQAADMALKAPPPAPAPAWTWTGCYIGANVGGGWSKQTLNRIDQIGVGPAPSYFGNETDSGVVGGGQVGCDYQFAKSWVIGVEGQFDWGDLHGSHVNPSFPTFYFNDRTRNFDTATVRLGYAFTNNMLAYVKGGGAWARNYDALFGAGPPVFLSENATWTAGGYTAGGGLEWRVARNWSVFAEYDYMNFGTRTVTFIAPPGFVPVGEHIGIAQTNQTFLVGANFRWDWANPVAAAGTMFTK